MNNTVEIERNIYNKDKPEREMETIPIDRILQALREALMPVTDDIDPSST